MRWLGLVLLAGCSTWTTYDEGPDERPHVVEALRSTPAAGSMLIDGDRGYWARAGALDAEVKAFATALADALETATPTAPRVGTTNDRDVLVFASVIRSIATDRIEVEAYRHPDGIHYKVTIEASRDRYRAATCRATPDVERAWQSLIQAAKARAGDTLSASMGPHGPLRDIGIDFRGLEED